MTSENEYDSFTTCEFVSEEKNNDNKTNKVTFWIITLIYV